jgi:hypothetical protein
MTGSFGQSAHRLLAGLLGKEQSIATGLLLALTIWTVTRLVDGITGSGTIEYDTVYSPSTLASGEPAVKVEVTLANLSSDTAINNLQVLIADPDVKPIFSADPRDSECGYEPPAWSGGAVCEAHPVGMSFTVPILVPGTSVRAGIKYKAGENPRERPIVRIKPDGTTKFQLVEPGLQTFVTRHQAALLVSLLTITLVLFAISVAAGVRAPESPETGPHKTEANKSGLHNGKRDHAK